MVGIMLNSHQSGQYIVLRGSLPLFTILVACFYAMTPRARRHGRPRKGRGKAVEVSGKAMEVSRKGSRPSFSSPKLVQPSIPQSSGKSDLYIL